MKIRRILGLLLCVLLMGNLLVGCAKGTEKAAEETAVTGAAKATEGTATTEAEKEVAKEPVTIRIGFWPPDDRTEEIAMWEEYKKTCEEMYPYITVVPDHYDYDEDTFMPMALAGETPTVFQAWLTEPQKLIAGGYVADITDVVKSYKYDSQIQPNFMDIVTKDGKIYGLPSDGYGLGLAINLNIFKEAGLIDAAGLPMYPKTYDELMETCKIIKEKTGKAGLYVPTSSNNGGWIFTQTAWEFGAKFEIQEGDKWTSNIDSPEVLAALKYLHDLKFKYDVLLPDALLGWDEWIQNIGMDNVAMVVAAGDCINFPIRSFDMNKDALALAPIPAGPGGQFSLTGGKTYMFAADTTPEEVDACIKFLEIIGYTPNVTDAVTASWENTWSTRKADGELVGPGPINVWTNPERIAAEQVIIDKYTNCNMALFSPYYDATSKILRPEEPIMTQDLYSILDQVIQGAFADENADLSAILKDADETFQKDFLDTLE